MNLGEDIDNRAWLLWSNTDNSLEIGTRSLATHYPFTLIAKDGSVGMGISTPDSSSALDVSSTTKGFLPPRMTTAQRDAISSPATGLTIFNLSNNKLNVYNGSSWVDLEDANPSGSSFGSTSNDLSDYVHHDDTVDSASSSLRTLVDITGEKGTLMGGVVHGYYFQSSNGGNNYKVTIEVDGVSFTYPKTALNVGYSQDQSSQNAGNIVLPVINYDNSLKITYWYTGSNITVSSYAMTSTTAGGSGAGLSTNSIQTTHIQDSAITSSKINNNAVTLDKVDFASTDGINIPQLAANPGSGTAGQTYYNSTTNKLMYYNGSLWLEMGSSSGAGVVSGYAHAEDATYRTIASVLPLDNSIPQLSEGSEVITLSYTPKSSTNKLLIRAIIPYTAANNSTLVSALFRSDQSSAIASTAEALTNNSYSGNMILEKEITAGTTSALTFSIRMGNNAGSNIYVNGYSGDRLGSSDRATITVMEIGSGGGAGSADNLGDHTATQNINLGTNKLVGNGGTEGLNILANGNIGLGTSAPQSKLMLSTSAPATSSSDDIITASYNNTGNAAVLIGARARGTSAAPLTVQNGDVLGGILGTGWDGSTFSPNGSAIYMRAENTFSTSVDSGIEFQTSKAGVMSSKMVIDKDGNIGIGTTAPTQKLDVQGVIAYGNGTNSVGRLSYGTSVVTLEAGSTNTSIALLPSGTGNVGIGTTTPAGKLDVNGTVCIGGVCRGSWPTGSGTGAFTDGGTKAHYSGGRVGIGTANPEAFLHVKGALNEWVTFERNSKKLFLNANWSDTNTFAQVAPSNASNMDLSLSSSDTSPNQLYLKNGGNIGAGTNNPSYQFHVESSNPTIGLVDTDDSDKWFLSNQNGEFTIAQAGVSDWLTIEPGGHVGLGTANPTSKLHVESGLKSGDNIIAQFETADTNGQGIYVKSLTNTGTLIQSTESNVVNNNLFLNYHGGNVGIGTITPSEKLTVAGNIATGSGTFTNSIGGSGNIILDNGTVDTPGIIFPHANNQNFGIDVATTNGGLRFVEELNEVGGIARMVINEGGNVGIGHTIPATKLDVNGSVRGTSAYQSTSDKRFKKNIKVITSAREKIKKLSGVSYVWRLDEFPEKEFEKGIDIGVIAQNVETVFPEAVLTDDDGYKSVAYAKLVAPLIEAFKEIDLEIEKNKKLFAFMQEGIQMQVDENSRRIASLEKEKVILKKEVENLKEKSRKQSAEVQLLKSALCRAKLLDSNECQKTE